LYFAPATHTGALIFRLSSGVITVHLTGIAVAAPTTLLTVLPPSLAFDGYTVGDNPDQVITVSNPDGVPAGIRSISATVALFPRQI